MGVATSGAGRMYLLGQLVEEVLESERAHDDAGIGIPPGKS